MLLNAARNSGTRNSQTKGSEGRQSPKSADKESVICLAQKGVNHDHMMLMNSLKTVEVKLYNQGDLNLEVERMEALEGGLTEFSTKI